MAIERSLAGAPLGELEWIVRYTHRDGPIVVVTPPVPLSDARVDRMLAELVRQLERGEPYALVFDMSNAEMPTPTQRRKLSDHLREHQSAIVRCVRGMALVAPSAALRGVATAVFWISPPPIEYRLFSELEEAMAWAKTRGA